jgi:hypothetical protein
LDPSALHPDWWKHQSDALLLGPFSGHVAFPLALIQNIYMEIIRHGSTASYSAGLFDDMDSRFTNYDT